MLRCSLPVDQLDLGIQPLPWHTSVAVQDEDQPALVVCLLSVAIEGYTDSFESCQPSAAVNNRHIGNFGRRGFEEDICGGSFPRRKPGGKIIVESEMGKWGAILNIIGMF